MFVTRQVIFFPMVHSSSAVSMGGEFVELGSSLVRIVWHTRFYLILTCRLTVDIRRNCPIVNTRDANRFFYNPEEPKCIQGASCRIILFLTGRPCGFSEGHASVDRSTAFRSCVDRKLAIHQLQPLNHADQTEPRGFHSLFKVKTGARIAHREMYRIR